MNKIKLSAALLMIVITASTQASVVNEIEGNDDFATAQNINGGFSLDFDPDIGNTTTNTSTSLHHVSILGTGNLTFDFYQFTTNGGTSIFDIDYASGVGGGLADSSLNLFDSTHTSLMTSDDSSLSDGQGGSLGTLDSYIETYLSPGIYFIQVSHCCDDPVDGTYTLQVSTVPEPATMTLIGIGLIRVTRRKFFG